MNTHPLIPVRIARVKDPLPEGLELLPPPKYQTVGASGFDIAADIRKTMKVIKRDVTGHESLVDEYCVIVNHGEIAIIQSGFIFEVPLGFELQVRPRGGTAIKKGVTVINTPGTLDADYRGELMVGLINLSREPFRINRGDRIAQAVICPVVQADMMMVDADELSQTERGEGRFNSTGVKTEKWVPPIACAKCQAPIRKFAIGNETPCRDCDGLLCEKCCDERKKGPTVTTSVPLQTIYENGKVAGFEPVGPSVVKVK